ncbi:hypothetical protein IFT98_09140 [Pseudomonas sp. CFBP 8770]|uniref:hypothetical protein n=1 Tax=unclassified Pseudomonas TaxID=196821 RepID=UPI00177EA46B|nr:MULTISPECIES: hypothetical protein [unclassified Pseudomonas]MBD8474021.1 hypothetical protein [Pseudomonas sp. CFBP 8773]MBD8647150.1 hypothetical protein [Pseudomonas sp. CFBP 8770]
MTTEHDTSAAQPLATPQAVRKRKGPFDPPQALIDALRRASEDGVIDTANNAAHSAIAQRRPRPSPSNPHEDKAGISIEP